MSDKLKNASFSNFFNKEYYLNDKEYIKFNYRLDEMSKPHYIYKQPIKFDRDDISYLEQFPRRFWTQALYYRYHDDLLEALEDRDHRRRPLYKAKFKEVYPIYLEKYKDKSPKIAVHMARQAAQLDAEEFAAKHPEGQVEYPEEQEYIFTKQGGHKEKIIAKPQMKALVHKLEKEYGDPEGYDLEYPRRGKGTEHSATRGMNLMKWHTAGRRLTDWLNYVGHHMLGQLPDPDHEKGITWGPDSGEGLGSGKVKDTFTITRIRREFARSWWEKIPEEEDVSGLWELAFGEKPEKSPEEIKSNNSLRRKLAEALGWLNVTNLAKRGEIRTPPSPNHPNGQIVQVNSSGEIINPELYLPKKKTNINYIDQNTGEIITKTEEIPILLPGKILRKLTDSEINSIESSLRTGKHWNSATKTWEADYIPVEHYPYSDERPDEDEDENDFSSDKPRFVRAGAMHPNQNSTGRKYLPPTHPKYEERLTKLETEMVHGDVDANFNFIKGNSKGLYFKDIVEAVNQAINQNRGDSGDFEKATLRAMRSDLHTLGYMSLIENLDDPKIWVKSYRKERIRIMVGNFAQQDWGHGTRRLRNSKNDPKEINLINLLGEKIEKAKNAMTNKKLTSCGPGSRSLLSGECNFTYDLRTLFELLEDAEKDAVEADEESEMATMANNVQMEKNALLGKRDALVKAFVVLSKHFINTGKSEEQANEEAVLAISNINYSSNTAKDILSGVKKLIDSSSKKNKEEELALDIWQNFEEFLTKDEVDFERKMIAKRSEAEAVVERHPFLKPRWEQLLNKLYNLKRTQPQQQPDNKTLAQLVADKEWEIIPFTKKFIRSVESGAIGVDTINFIIQKLKGGTSKYRDIALAQLQRLLEIASKK